MKTKVSKTNQIGNVTRDLSSTPFWHKGISLSHLVDQHQCLNIILELQILSLSAQQNYGLNQIMCLKYIRFKWKFIVIRKKYEAAVYLYRIKLRFQQIPCYSRILHKFMWFELLFPKIGNRKISCVSFFYRVENNHARHCHYKNH
jgi:hypothetical protein